MTAVIHNDDDGDNVDNDDDDDNVDNDDDDYNDDNNHDSAAYQGRYRLVTLIVKKMKLLWGWRTSRVQGQWRWQQ